MQQITGSYRVPIGIPYLELDEVTHKGKIIDKIDISVTPNVPIFMELAKTELQIINLSSENRYLELDAIDIDSTGYLIDPSTLISTIALNKSNIDLTINNSQQQQL